MYKVRFEEKIVDKLTIFIRTFFLGGGGRVDGHQLTHTAFQKNNLNFL